MPLWLAASEVCTKSGLIGRESCSPDSSFITRNPEGPEAHEYLCSLAEYLLVVNQSRYHCLLLASVISAFLDKEDRAIMNFSKDGFEWTPTNGFSEGVPTVGVVTPDSWNSSEPDEIYDVIVLGAGFAGLVASRDLATQGLSTVPVWKMRDN